jgi:hypothetical protein
MNKMSNMSQTKLPYLVTAVGVGLMAISELYSYVRAVMFRAMFQTGGGSYGSGFSGRHFGGGFGVGLPSILTTIAVVVAVVGILWLGLALRKSPKSV